MTSNVTDVTLRQPDKPMTASVLIHMQAVIVTLACLRWWFWWSALWGQWHSNNNNMWKRRVHNRTQWNWCNCYVDCADESDERYRPNTECHHCVNTDSVYHSNEADLTSVGNNCLPDCTRQANFDSDRQLFGLFCWTCVPGCFLLENTNFEHFKHRLCIILPCAYGARRRLMMFFL